MSLGRLGKRLLEKVGISVWRSRKLPYGIDLPRDLARLCGSRPPAMIFDVGGNVGKVTRALHARFPACTIHVFEPVASVYERLSDAVQNLTGVFAHKLALGSTAGEATMHVGPSMAQSSLVPCEGLADRRRPESVKVETVDAFCGRNRIDHIDLLKVDTEGYELEVLRGASRMLEEGRVRFIQAECEFSRVTVEPHTSFTSLRELLEPLRFRVVTFYSDQAGVEGLRWGNALFALQDGVSEPAGQGA